MNIKFEGSVTKQEFKNAAKLLNHPISKKTGLSIDSWVMLMIIGIVLIAISIRLLFVEQNFGTGSLFAAVGAVVFSYGMKVRTAVDRLWEESQKNNVKLEGTITDDYLEVQSQEGTSRILWTAFSGYGEYDGVVLLIRNNTGHPFSARLYLSEEDWQEFRKFITNKFTVTHKVAATFLATTNLYVLGMIIFSAIMFILVLLRRGEK